MAKGRKPLPDHLKVVKGTDQPCRMNSNPPDASKEAPETPVNLTDAESEKFEQLCAIVAGMGILSASDVHMLMLTAVRLAEIDRCQAVIQDEGETYVTPSGQYKPHPLVAQKNQAMRHAHVLLVEFGLSPSARSRVTAGTKEDENPFAALIGA